MYAVIETGGKQYQVEVGTELAVELLDAEPGQSITLDRVLLVVDGAETSIGRPTVDGASVAAEVVRQQRGDKVISFKYRPKARRRVKKGHRQEQMVLRITDVVFGGKSAAAGVRKAEAEAKSERQRLEEAAARQAAEDAALAAKLAANAAKAAKAAEAAAAPEGAKGAAAKPAAKGAAAKPAAKPAAKATSTKAAAGETPAPKKAPTKPAPAAKADSGETPAPKRTRTKKDE
jgi:large subunit ribosomal protein L21